jgi:hypothetical protein
MVVKTRGSAHGSGHLSFTIGNGGLLIGPPLKMFGANEDKESLVVVRDRKH